VGGKNGSGRGSIKDKLITEIRRRIIAREIPPRVSISAPVLAEESGVSRMPVRKTFKQLQTADLVEIRPRVGTFVTTRHGGRSPNCSR
jgi:DNA-binding GntR family transcriptional regulator